MFPTPHSGLNRVFVLPKVKVITRPYKAMMYVMGFFGSMQTHYWLHFCSRSNSFRVIGASKMGLNFTYSVPL